MKIVELAPGHSGHFTVAMDVYISEEYVIKRREERKMSRETADGGRARQQTVDRRGEEKGRPKRTAWTEREKSAGVVSDDAVFACFSP